MSYRERRTGNPACCIIFCDLCHTHYKHFLKCSHQTFFQNTFFFIFRRNQHSVDLFIVEVCINLTIDKVGHLGHRNKALPSLCNHKVKSEEVIWAVRFEVKAHT
jgi:hypothetical protein